MSGYKSFFTSEQRVSRRARFVALLLLACLFGDRAVAQRNVVVVRSKEIKDVLANPGMGITTLQRFNDQELNPPLKWSEVGPEKKLAEAAAKQDYPDTSVSYSR